MLSGKQKETLAALLPESSIKAFIALVCLVVTQQHFALGWVTNISIHFKTTFPVSETQRWTGRLREIYLLAYSENTCNGHGWARLKP